MNTELPFSEWKPAYVILGVWEGPTLMMTCRVRSTETKMARTRVSVSPEFRSAEEAYAYYVGEAAWGVYIVVAVVLLCVGVFYPR
jgi:hypothetical protein